MTLNPMLATATTGAGRGYVHSLANLQGNGYIAQYKLDGIRAILTKTGDTVTIHSRNGQDYTRHFPRIVQEALDRLGDITLDGEIMCDSQNSDDVNAIIAGGKQRSMPRFYAFDMPEINATLTERLQTLRFIGRGLYIRPLRTFTDLLKAEETARERGHEGLIVKAAGSPYLPGERSKHWLKFKFTETVTAAINGFTQDPQTGELTTLELALVDSASLVIVGKISSGWTIKQGKEILQRLNAGKTQLIEVEYLPSTKTALRFGTFRGFRDDLSILEATLAQLQTKD